VRDETVINTAEYGEVLRFTKEITREYEARVDGPDEVSRGLHELRQMIEQRAPVAEVAATSRKLLPLMMQALGTNDQPATLPNLAAGRRLWVSDCAPCHGIGGAGDGPSAAGMEPPPTAFRGEFLEQLSPRRVYHSITFGIDGTAMPSFVPAYTERQRWDVAFFVMTLRVDFEPKRPADAARFTLEELATSSNAELLARLRAKRAEAPVTDVDWLRANFPSLAGGSVPFAGPDAANAGVAAALQLQDVFANVADRIFPRVVGVSGYVRGAAPTPSQNQGWSAGTQDQFRYPGFRPIRSGTGFLVDDEGYVLSRDHLVRDERGELVEFVDVELQDQSHLAARVIGAEPTLDLALLQVADAAPVSGSALEFADSDQVQLGQWLIALGDPPGPAKAFAVGLASAASARQCYQSERSATRLQTSLAVPTDALGGPVTDIFGHVVGMSVQQQAPLGAPAAAGPTATHVLPVNLVLNLYEALKLAQSKQSPWLGVSVLELPLLRQQLGEDASSIAIPQTGVYIDEVFDPSPATKAGVRPGDFLLGLGGHRLLSVGDFQTWLYVLGIGTEVEIELQRDGRPLRMVAVIEERPLAATTR
jgi:S1-C subfamily serine protease/mono/diheme cytochrome c family protein